MKKITYHIDLIKEDGTGYFVKVREFSGCMTQGESINETLLNISDAMTGWLTSAINHGDRKIPIPISVKYNPHKDYNLALDDAIGAVGKRADEIGGEYGDVLRDHAIAAIEGLRRKI